jgi:hypothetical protein
VTYAQARALTMDPERETWLRRVASAARSAADDVRGLNDPSASDLLADLEELHTRLIEELRAAGLDD